jgi:RNA polymerase-interacting CarD/CdnL/TRCF family regulator
MFHTGDLIFHPRHGFGSISGLTRRDPLPPIRGVLASEGVSDQAQDYYEILLSDGGTLLVPVHRAESVGLRILTNGVAAILTAFHSPAGSLPENQQARAIALQARGQSREPSALADSVRDMLAQSRGRSLSASERTWLDKSCERLSAEAALVDRIPRTQASAAIWEAVNQASGR